MKLTGIKSVCSATQDMPRYGLARTVEQLYVDCKTGEVWSNTEPSSQSWTVYDDPNVIHCCCIRNRATMQEIREMVESAISQHDYRIELLRSI